MSRFMKVLTVIILTITLGLGSMGAAGGGVYDAFKQTFGDAKWHIKLNAFIDRIGRDITSLANIISDWVGTDSYLMLIQQTPTYVSGNSFTVPGDYTARLTAGKVVWAELGTSLVTNTVASASYAGGATTVNLTTSNLTNPIARVYAVTTRDGLWGTALWLSGADYGSTQTALLTADALAASAGKALVIGSEYLIDTTAADVTLASALMPIPGGRLTRAGSGTHHVIISKLAARSGLFKWIDDNSTGHDWVRFGVGAVNEVYPQWWGASGVYGASNDDTPYIQAAANSLIICKGTVFCPTGDYRVDQVNITTEGLSFVGAGSATVFYKELGSIGNYFLNVDISSGANPKYFRFGDFKISGNTATRTFSGIKLKGVREGGSQNIYFTGLNHCLDGDLTYWCTFKDMWFDNYNQGLGGVTSQGFNSNTFINMFFQQGNLDGSAVPLDTTYMGDCHFIGGGVGASATTKISTINLPNIDANNIYTGMRFEVSTTPLSDGDWVTITGSGHHFKDCYFAWGGAGSPKDGKYVFNISGSNNSVDSMGIARSGNYVYLSPASKENEIRLDNSDASGENIVADYGDNLVHYGKSDHMRGGNSWSEVPLTNLFVRSIDFGGVTLDGVTKTLQTGTAGRGPLNLGRVYRFDTPTGNRQWYQDIGAIAQYEGRIFSIWVKAVNSGSGHTENINLIYDSSLDTVSRIIRDDAWTRVWVANQTAHAGGYSHHYVGIQIGASSNGIYCWGPQVISLGATPDVFAGLKLGGYIPTYTSPRTDEFPGRDQSWEIAAPTTGIWSLGRQLKNLNPSSGNPMGFSNSAGGEPGTWKAQPNIP